MLRNPPKALGTQNREHPAHPAQRLNRNFRNFVELTSLSKSATMELQIKRTRGFGAKIESF